ncbi:MAG: helix-turn-helix domain-containing protein [Salegentibacter sp.]
MVNNEKFAERLHKILRYYDLSAAAFADQIEVGRSSISHILSGRNKPSLDFVMKVIQNFPEVELYWLLNGKGKFPKNETAVSAAPAPSPQPASEEPVRENSEEREKLPQEMIPQPSARSSSKEIRKIVIFYADGTFEAFEN